jgi:predicted HicB family RNase H-like nuclease
MDEKKMFATRIDADLHKALKLLSVKAEISISQLAEEAFKDLIKKHEKKDK